MSRALNEALPAAYDLRSRAGLVAQGLSANELVASVKGGALKLYGRCVTTPTVAPS